MVYKSKETYRSVRKTGFVIEKWKNRVYKVHNIEVKTDGKTQKYKSLKSSLTTNYLTTRLHFHEKTASKNAFANYPNYLTTYLKK